MAIEDELEEKQRQLDEQRRRLEELKAQEEEVKNEIQEIDAGGSDGENPGGGEASIIENVIKGDL